MNVLDGKKAQYRFIRTDTEESDQACRNKVINLYLQIIKANGLETGFTVTTPSLQTKVDHESAMESAKKKQPQDDSFCCGVLTSSCGLIQNDSEAASQVGGS